MLSKFVNNGTDKLVCETLRKSEQTYVPDDFEKRTIKISGHPATLDKIEQMIGYMEMLGSIGHSTSFTVGVDGDGGFSCRCADDKGKELSKKHSEWLETHLDSNHDIKSFNFD